ncbi:MAG: ABC transporter permease [Gemmatimonadetes bacterium]|nr:ABC transporter permease [Gemmatimonadota bacterium]
MNLRLALRTLFKAPFVTAIAILSLALGIGANAAIFSLFEEMLLRALPVQEPERLVNLGAPGPKPGSQSCSQAGSCDAVFSYPMFRDLERAQTVFTGIAAHRAFAANLAFRNQTLSAEGMLVSGSYFPVLGVRPALGRLLGPADDQAIGANFVAVLSHSFWTTRLGADPGVLNETIVVNGHPLTIVGVAPAGFQGTTLGTQPSVFVPITMRGLMSPGFDDFENRRSYWAYLFARLKPGVSLTQADAALNGLYRSIINDVEAPLQKGMSDATMKRFRAKRITLEPGARGQSSIHREAKAPLVLLFSITGVVLLIACANIANLLLARGAGRAQEMAVRLSLGASRRQVVTQLLVESCLLAALGGAASLLVARWTLALIASLLPADAVGTLHLGLRMPVVLFAAALSIGTGVLFGLFPAIHSTRPDIVSALKANARQPSGNRAAARFRTSLVTAQIALSMALLVSAGLFIRSLVNVSRVDLGLRIDNVVAFRLSPELNGYAPARSHTFFQRVEEALRATPGVTAVSAALVPILSGSNWGTDVAVQGFRSGPDIDSNARLNEVSAGYFRAFGVPLLAGREFTPADALGRPKVAIVNEAFAKKFNLGRDAVGKWMSMGRSGELDMEIVGLVQNAKYSDVKEEVPPLFFVPWAQDSTIGAMTFYVRTALPPERLLKTIPRVIAGLDPNLPVEDLKTLPQQVRENVFLDRMISTLSAAFAALATLLAAVGLYGVLAYTVAQRTREFGVRMALGADSRRVRALVLRHVARMVAVGGAVGIAAALGIGRAARSLLFGLSGQDPVALGAAAVLLALVAAGAGYIPALRASRVQPAQALRYE